MGATSRIDEADKRVETKAIDRHTVRRRAHRPDVYLLSPVFQRRSGCKRHEGTTGPTLCVPARPFVLQIHPPNHFLESRVVADRIPDRINRHERDHKGSRGDRFLEGVQTLLFLTRYRKMF